jgi:hypothetical protein
MPVQLFERGDLRQTSLLAAGQGMELGCGVLDDLDGGGADECNVPGLPVERPGVIARHDALHWNGRVQTCSDFGVSLRPPGSGSITRPNWSMKSIRAPVTAGP